MSRPECNAGLSAKRKAERDARPRCKATSRNGSACSLAGTTDGYCGGHARVARRGRACGLLKRAKPCGSCSGCDEARFAGWLERVKAGLGTSDDEDSPRFALAQEIHADLARRHPFGLAQQVASVIASLHIAEDDDATAELEDMVATEQESQALNGSSATCSAWAKQADERKARRSETKGAKA